MRDDDPFEGLAPEGGKAGATSQTLERWASERDVAHRESLFREPDEIHAVPIPSEGDVITEPLREFRRLGDAADHRERDHVVEGRIRIRAETDALGHTRGDEPGPKHMLHGLAEAEIRREREGGDQLCQPDAGSTLIVRIARACVHRLRRLGAEGNPVSRFKRRQALGRGAAV